MTNLTLVEIISLKETGIITVQEARQALNDAGIMHDLPATPPAGSDPAEHVRMHGKCS